MLDAIADSEAKLARLAGSADMPDQPDRAWVDDWLHRTHLAFWAAQGGD